MLWGITRLGVEPARQRFARRCTQASPRGMLRLIAHERWHQRIGGHVHVVLDVARQRCAVDGENQRAAQRRVVTERRHPEVEPQHVDAQPRRIDDLVAEHALEPGPLAGGKGIRELHIARKKTQHRLRPVGHVEVDHRLQPHMRRVPVIGIGAQRDARADQVFLQREGAVTDQVFRSHPVVPVTLDGRTVDRVEIVLYQQFEQVGRRCIEVYGQRVGVGRRHAERVGRLVPECNIQRVEDGGERLRVARAGPGVYFAAPGIDEVLGRQRCAVGPARLRPQMKHPRQAIRALLPGDGGAGYGLAIDAQCGEALEQVVKHALRGNIGGQLRIERSGCIVERASQRLDRRQRGADGYRGGSGGCLLVAGGECGEEACHKAARAREPHDLSTTSSGAWTK